VSLQYSSVRVRIRILLETEGTVKDEKTDVSPEEVKGPALSASLWRIIDTEKTMEEGWM
jgi:hypothetical protein